MNNVCKPNKEKDAVEVSLLKRLPKSYMTVIATCGNSLASHLYCSNIIRVNYTVSVILNPPKCVYKRKKKIKKFLSGH